MRNVIAVIVFLVFLAGVAYLALPHYKGHPAAANENAAVSALRSYVSAQSIFHRGDSDGDGVLRYASSLKELASGGAASGPLIDPELAKATSPGAGCHGYYFVIFPAKAKPGENEPGASLLPPLVAVPCQYGKTGCRTLFTDESGNVYWRDTGGKAPEKLPAEPKAEAWEIVE